VIKCVLELVTATADEFFRLIQRDYISWPNYVTRFVGSLIINADLAGENGTFGFLPAYAKTSINQSLVQAEHGRY
jgi:hypothetical protein